MPKEKQKEAVKFLLDHAFTTPTKMLNPAVVNQFKYSGVVNDVLDQQRALLRSLFSSSRLTRLLDAEVLAGDKAYTVLDLVTDVQAGLWSELKGETPKIDPLRRTLQRAYLDLLRSEFETHDGAAGPAGPRGIPGFFDPPARSAELRAVARQALHDLSKQITGAVSRTKDVATTAHLQDSITEIETILAEKKK